MDFGTREILILLGILVILAILLDGVRRVNSARHGKLRSGSRRSSRNPIFDDESDDYHSSELPGGHARVVKVRDEKSVVEVSETIRRNCDSAKNKLTSAFRSKVEQEQPAAPDHDPAIFDTPATNETSRRDTPLFVDDDEFYDNIGDKFSEQEVITDYRAGGADTESYPSKSYSSKDYSSKDFSSKGNVIKSRTSPDRDTGDDESGDYSSTPPQPGLRFESTREESVEPDISLSPASMESKHSTTVQDHGQRDDSRNRPASGRSAPSHDDILILHLMAHKGQNFEGEKLLEQILDQGLRYGSMKIFHRHENKDGSGSVHFSLANSVNPGTFDLNTMEQFASPGVTFIMPLDGLERPLESFDVLINTATTIAKKLDGELKDETRSALTKQTIEHYRQRIIDYTRRSFTLTN